MSMGYGGWCFVEVQDEQMVIYQYGSYNLNDSQYRNNEQISDGVIIIDKSSLVEPQIHQKIKRFQNGKKRLIIKRIVVDVPYSDLLESGKIQIINSSNSWEISKDGKDYIAWHLIWIIFTEYQKTGELLSKVGFDV